MIIGVCHSISEGRLSAADLMFDDFPAKKRCLAHGSNDHDQDLDSSGVPLWFANFAHEQTTTLKRLVSVQERMVQSMDKQNEVLEQLKDVLVGMNNTKKE